MGLVEVLEDDGDVHVDDDHEVDDDEGDEVDHGDEGVAAVAVGQPLVVGVTAGRGHQQRLQDVVPPRRRHQPAGVRACSKTLISWGKFSNI